MWACPCCLRGPSGPSASLQFMPRMHLSSIFSCFLLFLTSVLSVLLKDLCQCMWKYNIWTIMRLWATTKAKLRLLLCPETQPAPSPALPTALVSMSVGRSAKKKGRKEHFLSAPRESLYTRFPFSTQGAPGSWLSLPSSCC